MQTILPTLRRSNDIGRLEQTRMKTAAARLLALSVLVTISRQAIADAPRTLRAANDAELVRAFADIRPGDTILVADGTYREPLLLKTSGDGTGNPISIK